MSEPEDLRKVVDMLSAHDPKDCVNGLRCKCPKCAAWHLKQEVAW